MRMSLEQIYFFECGAVLALTVMILWVAVIIPGMNKWNKNFFVTLFVVFVLGMIALFADLLFYGDPSFAMVEKIIIYSEYLFLSIPTPMFTAYLLHTCGENLRKNLILRTAIILWCIYFILLGIAQFTEIFYYVTPDNQYIRNSWYLILMTPIFTAMFLNTANVIYRRKKLSKKYYIAFMIHLLSLQIALFIQNMIFESLLIVTLGLSISTLSMFVIILYDQIEQYLNQQREIYNQRTSIMVLQMRPHFIYNAMMSIYYLCAKDSKKAQQVTLDFTTYLRKNFTAIASEDTVPFEDELEHTRAYLAIEQVQFEDNLLVEYDTPHKNFQLPPLTLQPIVENAVKHGMDPASAPLCIKIQTRQINSGSEIIVEDNGTGFEFGAKLEPNTTLANIRQRLKIMCGGKLAIQTSEGGGTAVTVTIPNFS